MADQRHRCRVGIVIQETPSGMTMEAYVDICEHLSRPAITDAIREPAMAVADAIARAIGLGEKVGQVDVLPAIGLAKAGREQVR